MKDVDGTGKDGRVLKEDVQNYIDSKTAKDIPRISVKPSPASSKVAQSPVTNTLEKGIKVKSVPVITPLPDRKEPIKGYTVAMIKTMTVANVKLLNVKLSDDVIR